MGHNGSALWSGLILLGLNELVGNGLSNAPSLAHLLSLAMWCPLQDSDVSRGLNHVPASLDFQASKTSISIKLFVISHSVWDALNGLKQRLYILETHEDILSISFILLHFGLILIFALKLSKNQECGVS